MLRFNIQSLQEGKVEKHSAEPSAETVGLDQRFSKMQVQTRLNKQGKRILVSFDARAVARLECDRTLQEFDQPLEASYTFTFVPSGQMTKHEQESEGIRPLGSQALEIDITKEVRDTLLLAVPARRIAPKAKDVNIQLQFGSSKKEAAANPPIAPRWNALKKLHPRSDEE